MNTQQQQRATQMQAARANLAIDTYNYSIPILSVATTASGSGTVQIQAQSDFEVYQLIGIGFVTSTGAAADSSLITVQLTDTGSGSTMFDRALPLTTAFGTPDLPFILPVPRIFTANSTLQADITNGSGDTVSVWLVFPGRRLFRRT